MDEGVAFTVRYFSVFGIKRRKSNSQHRFGLFLPPEGRQVNSFLFMTAHSNYLVDLIPRKDRIRFTAECEVVELKLAEVLCEPGKPTKYVYFPIQGFISLIAVVKGSPGVEVGMVGREGMAN